MTERPKVLRVSEELIPKNSNATTAAEVILGSGERTIVEMFDDGSSADFRGLPDHLSNGDHMTIIIGHDPLPDGPPNALGPVDHHQRAARRNHLLFEFAIGARQELWHGAYPVYDDDNGGPTRDPASRHYSILTFTGSGDSPKVG